MQEFLQKDLFSEVLEPLTPPQKKSRAKPKKTESLELDLPEVAAPAPRHEPEVLQAEKPAAKVVAAPIVDEAEDNQDKAPGAFKTISEVAGFLGLPQHVLRFWESRFSQIKPLKMRGGRRYYRPEDIEILSTIKHLLYKQGYTINGAKKAFSQGKNALVANVQLETVTLPPASDKPRISDKQKTQLAAIREELYALRETLKPYMEHHPA